MYSQVSPLLFFSETRNLRRGSRAGSPSQKTLSGGGGGVEINKEERTTTSQIDIFDCAGSYIPSQACLPSYGCGKHRLLVIDVMSISPNLHLFSSKQKIRLPRCGDFDFRGCSVFDLLLVVVFLVVEHVQFV